MSAFLDLRLAAIQKAEEANKKIREENKKIKQAKKQRKQIQVPYLKLSDFNYEKPTIHAEEFRDDSTQSKKLRADATKLAEKKYADLLKKYEDAVASAAKVANENKDKPIEASKESTAIPPVDPKVPVVEVAKIDVPEKPSLKKIVAAELALAEKEILKRQNQFLSKQISFSEYLRVMQTSGTPVYLSMLAKMKKQLDQELGAGQCTKDQYINL